MGLTLGDLSEMVFVFSGSNGERHGNEIAQWGRYINARRAALATTLFTALKWNARPGVHGANSIREVFYR